MPVEHWADQELRPDSFVAPLLADPRREPRAGGIAADPEPGRIDPELFRMRGDPRRRGEGILQSRRERVLGREPVIDRDDPEAAGFGEHPADPVMGVETAGHQPAAVQVDEAGAALAFHRRVEPRGDRTGRTRQDEIAGLDALGAQPGESREPAQSLPAGVEGDAVRAPERHHVEEAADMRIEGHRRLPARSRQSFSAARTASGHASMRSPWVANSATARRSMPKATQPVWAGSPSSRFRPQVVPKCSRW